MTATRPNSSTDEVAFPGAPARLLRELEVVRAELARVDAKATALIGWAGTALAILAAAASITRLPLAALAAVITAAVLLATAVATLLGVIRPALPTRRPRGRAGAGYGFIRHAAAVDVGELIAGLACDASGVSQQLGEELLQASKLTARKYRWLRLAVHLLLGALLAMATALPLTLLGRSA
ncbi:Pycsar system effector family protein [Nonomuraea sp. NPDC048882]|uniref:Pycsar system effector family protein n=1 Tax=Nonomuraea sp. NPDC048882 TaxID=3154347 RepID=UPI0033F98951